MFSTPVKLFSVVALVALLLPSSALGIFFGQDWSGVYNGTCTLFGDNTGGPLTCSEQAIAVPYNNKIHPNATKTGLLFDAEFVTTRHTRNGLTYGYNGASFGNLIMTPLWTDVFGTCVRLSRPDLPFYVEVRVGVNTVFSDVIYTEEGVEFLVPEADGRLVKCPPKYTYAEVGCNPAAGTFIYRCVNYRRGDAC